jgi:hypothetical protein
VFVQMPPEGIGAVVRLLAAARASSVWIVAAKPIVCRIRACMLCA